MILLAELGELVRETVRRFPGLKVHDRIAAAARLLRLPRGRVEDWWYGEVRRVEASEADTIRRYAAQAQYKELHRLEREVERLRAEIDALAPPRPRLDRAPRTRPRQRRYAPA